MRLSRYLQRTRALGDSVLNAAELDALEDAIGRGDDLPTVARARAVSYASLTPRSLLTAWRAARSLVVHQKVLEGVTERRKAQGLPPVVPALLAQTAFRHEIAALERADALTPPGQVAEHRRRDGIKEAVLVWNACVALASRDTVVRVKVLSGDDEATFSSAPAGESLSSIEPFRWLALRRAQKEGKLTLSVDLPMDSLAHQVVAHYDGLKAIGAGRDARGLLQALVLSELGEAICDIKDDEAGSRAIQAACEAYLNLLCASRPRVNVVCGISLGKKGAQLAYAILGRDGRIVASGKATAGDDPVAVVRGLCEGQGVDGIVLPTTADDAALLERLETGFQGQPPVYRIRPVAMKEAVLHINEEASPMVGQAIVLARRCIRPMRTWSQVDPIALGIIENQDDLSPELLRSGLDDVRSLALAGVKPDELTRLISTQVLTPPPKPVAPVAVKAAPVVLNPMVKSVDDVRPGMKLNGVVTNITQFGAFVNIGLPQEGLVHVSELADHFIKDAFDAVKIGQAVSPRVLGIDRVRGRISLSLKAEKGTSPDPRATMDAPTGPPSRDRGQGGGRGAPPSRETPAGSGPGRTKALSDLDALFRRPK